jgi:hypothetical protein
MNVAKAIRKATAAPDLATRQHFRHAMPYPNAMKILGIGLGLDLAHRPVANFGADVALEPRAAFGWWLYGRNLKVPPARGGGELGSRSNSGAAPATVVE